MMPWAEWKEEELALCLHFVDPLLRPSLLQQWSASLGQPPFRLPYAGNVVLVGHRAAGKSTLSSLIAGRLACTGYDLDHEIELRTKEPLRDLFARDQTAFRRLERDVFRSLPGGTVVSVGGGFLSHHADLLEGHLAVLVPISFTTYRERLLKDATRPRLRPELSLEDEIRVVYDEREALHARIPTVPLADFLARGVV
ncbi:MAG: shikimate kinase [Myxococcota bacterium]